MRGFARGFRLTMPDGEQFDGAEYPNGFVVTVHREAGMGAAAITLNDLLEGTEGALVEWAESED
jgi:hypothetical protein